VRVAGIEVGAAGISEQGEIGREEERITFKEFWLHAET
jgi:hypothetical protein